MQLVYNGKVCDDASTLRSVLPKVRAATYIAYRLTVPVFKMGSICLEALESYHCSCPLRKPTPPPSTAPVRFTETVSYINA